MLGSTIVKKKKLKLQCHSVSNSYISLMGRLRNCVSIPAALLLCLW